MKAPTPIGILLGVVLLLIAVSSSLLIFKLRPQQDEATQPAIETAP